MIDRDLIVSKAGLVRKHLERVKEKCGQKLETFLNSADRQDIVSFNIQLAIQNCIDIAAHIVSEEGTGVPGSVNEIFYFLQEEGYLSYEQTEKMVKAAAFRNLVVHEYGKIDLEQVFEIAQHDIKDLDQYLISIFSKLGITE